MTISDQGALIYFVAIPILAGAVGRVLSIALRGLPVRPAEFLSFGALEVVLGIVIIVSHSFG